MAKAPSPFLRVLAWTVLTGLVAGLVSCGLIYALTSKLLVGWQALPPPPEPAAALAGATITTVDVQSAGGQLFRYSINQPEKGWTAVQEPLRETDAPCPDFLRSRRVRGMVERRLVCENYADGGATAAYARTADGRLFAWSAGDHAYEALMLVFCPPVFGVAGMLVGLVVGLVRRK